MVVCLILVCEVWAIIWDDRTYVPYCAFSKSDCGRQIGIVDGDKDDKVFEYKGYSSDEWIINYYANNMDTIMLLREIDVTDIPDNLHSEYEWNINQENKMWFVHRYCWFKYCGCFCTPSSVKFLFKAFSVGKMDIIKIITCTVHSIAPKDPIVSIEHP